MVLAAVRTSRFGPLEVDWDERVLAPRPWTLTQSRWAAELAAHGLPGALVELCAGAGQIGLAAAVLADRDLVQVEADPVAASYAAANAAKAGRAGRVDVRTARLDDALGREELFALVLADPPYLPTAQVSDWPADPVRAIDGGADGLAVIRTILGVAAAHMPSGGQLLLQVAGPAQAAEVIDLAGAGTAFRPGAIRTVDPRRAVLQLIRA